MLNFKAFICYLFCSFFCVGSLAAEEDLKTLKMKDAEFIQLDNGYRVWTKRVGNGPIKILTLHGGPGCTHEYFECMEKFFPKDQFQIIYYDQLGSYYSDQPDDPSLWTLDRFVEEVEQVRQALKLEDFYLYGQSWGGLLAIEYSLKYQNHLKGVILSNIVGSVESYIAYLNELRTKLPESVQKRLKYYEDRKEYHHPEYEQIMFDEVYSLHLCRIKPFPEAFLRTFMHLNAQVYETMQGPNEFVVTGNLKNWNRWNDLAKISIPTLLICGRYDTMNPNDVEKMGQLIPNSVVKICENGSHGAMYDDQDNYFNAILNWISSQSMKKTKKIEVTAYQSDWPEIFETEAIKIKEALGANCLAVHHIGSTAVPGLSAKPIIDMIVVVNNPEKAILPLENLGIKYKGEYNIPMRLYFSRLEGVEVHLHVYEEDHPEIELNLKFRDYLRSHPEARDEYAALKENLLKQKTSFEKNNSMFTGYNLGKDEFIRKILKAAHFDRIRILKCTHYAELDFAKNLRQKYFFDALSLTDPYVWTFNHKDHAHIILYKGVDMIGYAHIQFWPDQRAALRIFVIDEPHRHQGYGSQFLHLCEQWLKKEGIQSLHDEARPDSVQFYRKNGYSEMPFDDPSGELPSSQDIAMGKRL